jgi:uncharacterized iron-regulated protein
MNRLFLLLFTALALAGCARPSRPAGHVPTASADAEAARSDTAVLLLGEQHDEPEHQQRQRQMVEALAARGVLAALALEMAESGTSTAALGRAADEAAVRTALRWDERGWPWPRYAPAIMAAVRSGVPVVGANLPRENLGIAMADTALDSALPGPALKAQQQSIRIGHCGLLPESQIGPMTRVQIARDQSMAAVLTRLAEPGKTVLLIAGGGHVDPAVGVPVFLPPALERKAVMLPAPAEPKRDYCEDFRRSRSPQPAS